LAREESQAKILGHGDAKRRECEKMDMGNFKPTCQLPKGQHLKGPPPTLFSVHVYFFNIDMKIFTQKYKSRPGPCYHFSLRGISDTLSKSGTKIIRNIAVDTYYVFS